jgi:hypothetical protein
VLHDAFICHASEDKDEFVRPLAERLRDEHVEVWYDEFSLKIGDSLRRSIDQGLANARFGIVVLSPAFFEKEWSQWELDGLVSRQNSAEQSVILPVWHRVSRDDVLAFSPSLADKLAGSSASGLDAVVRQLVSVIHPVGSTLVIARDQLLAWGLDPPVVTDDWWLDLAAASESNELEGGFQEAMGWGRWGFPLPPSSEVSAERGWRLAWTALQRLWCQVANERPITQLTPPGEVHDFIAIQTGLSEVCVDHLAYLIAYAPQLVIQGFGGPFEAEIERGYQMSLAHCEERRSVGDTAGSALTTDGRCPGCDDEFALRDPDFGMYSPEHVACGFVQGNWVASGPPIQYYPYVDYAAWLLSDKSCWLPSHVRDTLTRGMAGWGVWHWRAHDRDAIDLGFVDEPFTGSFEDALLSARSRRTLKLGGDERRDLKHRLAFSAALLALPEDAETLAERLLAPNFLDRFFVHRAELSARRRRASRV